MLEKRSLFFSNELGCLQGMEVNFFKAYTVPLALKGKVEVELENLESISKLGMLQAYLQLPLDEESKKYVTCTVNTHEVILYRYNNNAKWTWGRKQNKAFKTAKRALQDNSLLVRHDESKPLVLACDASQYCLRAVLSHVTEDGKEKPVAYASQILMPAVKNSQIEKERLAIVCGIKNFIISSLADIS